MVTRRCRIQISGTIESTLTPARGEREPSPASRSKDQRSSSCNALVKCARVFRPRRNSFITFFRLVSLSMIGGCTCTHGDATMQQRSSSAGLTLHIFLFVLAIAGISAGVSVHASAQTPPSASSAESYVLGPNDRIRLKVYGESDITGEYESDNGGQVSIPLAGHIKAAGGTTRQLEKAIASALANGIVRDPRVNVEIAQYRPYYILGEVKK